MAKKQLNYIFVLIQHQAQSQEGIENIKLGRMRPTADGLGDAKTVSRDTNCLMGLYNPAKFLEEMNQKTYKDYDISRLKNDCRFLEIIDDRDYGAGGCYVGLFFDGAISTFKELPLPSDKEALERYYKYAEYLDTKEEQ